MRNKILEEMNNAISGVKRVQTRACISYNNKVRQASISRTLTIIYMIHLEKDL